MNAPIDISNVVLKTSRLILRAWRESDLEDFYAYASVDGVGQMAGWTPHRDREESRKILASFISHKHVFALEYQGSAIGSLGIEEYDQEKLPALDGLACRELGYVLSKEYWGHGLMPEAVREVTRWLFEDQGLDAIVCGHFVWNHQSARVQEKCGFQVYAQGEYQTKYETTEQEVLRVLYREDWLVQYTEAEPTTDVMEALLSMSEAWASENSCHGYAANQSSDIAGKRIFIAQRGGRTIGYLLGVCTSASHSSSVMAENTPCFEVEELYICPEYRSQGIGKALFEYAQSCVSGEAEYILLTTATKNWKAILHFYIEELGMTFWSARLFRKIDRNS